VCGIVGIWNEANGAVIAAMADSIAHRGPDRLDYGVCGRHAFGASRLAIFGDTSASAVFTDSRSDIRVLLNGEIFNCAELRDQLAASGVRFCTNLEAEVVASLYLQLDVNFASRLKGMFAIAILDGDRLLLARDRFGIKPLYYSDLGDRIVFGSEVKSILAHPSVRHVLNLSALEETAVFGYVYSPTDTMFDGIHQVVPGSVLTIEHGTRRESRFAVLAAAKYCEDIQHLDYNTAVSLLRERLIEAVESEFSHGNQDKGLYLSGGLDSTTIAVIARAVLGYPVTTFALADSVDNEDYRAASEVASQLCTKHVERLVSTSDYFDSLDDFIYHYEAIVSGGVFDVHGAVAFHLLSETVAEHVRVAFSGEGADELFGGYYWIYTHPLGFSDRIRGRLLNLKTPGRVQRHVDALFPEPENELAYRQNLLTALTGAGLSNYHLQSVDRSCGAFGFEVRPIYLYDDLADLALSLPIEFKVPDKGTTKRILRDAFRPEFEQLGLDWVLRRPKIGMPAALDHLVECIRIRMDAAVPDSHFARHPLRSYLTSKSDVYLFDRFAERFQVELPDAVKVGAS
jgi:asparagine synthase (glutamine-hydrolysing)